MSRVQWYSRRTLDTLHYEGPYILLWRILSQCVSPLGTLQPWTFYQRDLTRPIEEMPCRFDVSVTLAADSDFDQLATLPSRSVTGLDSAM